MVDINFQSWTPDLPAINNPGLLRAHNCSAGRGSVQGGVTLFPLKSSSLYSETSMASKPLGTAVGQNKFGDAKVYGGCATALYKLAPGTRTWTNISKTGGYTTSGTERWKSIPYGSLQIFTNYSDSPQVIDQNIDLQFADLTTLVKGRHINTHKGFVILGNTYDALDGAIPYRVRWSGIESPGDFNYSASTMADFQDIFGFGNIQGIVADDSAYIILQRGIVQMQFIGAPYAFSFTDRVVGKGCSVSQSIVTVESMTCFVSDDGFYMLQGGNLTPIGMGKIDRWFLDNFDSTKSHMMTVAADPRETLIYWQFCSKSAVGDKPDLILIYNYHSGEWTTADATTAYIFNSLSLPWTIDMLDTFATLDLVPASFDSPLWAGGNSMLWSMSETGAVYTFGGPTMQLSVETPEFQLSRILPNETNADIAIIDAARPIFEGPGVARVQVGTKSLPNAELSWSALKETSPITGFAYLREQSRYSRFRFTLSGDWTKASSLQIDGKTAGRR
jgi:hypothetical protein